MLMQYYMKYFYHPVPPDSGNARQTTPMWNHTANPLLNDSNHTNVTIPTEYNFEVLVYLPIMLFGITGNILVCMAVSMEKRLQSVTNYFLLSLAVTDLLVSVIVMPFSMIHQFFGYWPFNYIVCDFYVTCDVLMCTSSILHLCTISLERYLAISSPLAVRNKSKCVVILKIVLVWALSAAITSPITILGFVDQHNILNDMQCALTNADFIIYGSTGAFFIPLGIMVIAYGLTIRLLHHKSKMNRKDYEGQPIIRRSISRGAKQFRKRVKLMPRRTKSCPDKTLTHDLSHFANHNRTKSVKSCLAAPQSGDEMVTPPPSPVYKNADHDLSTINEENHNGIGWAKSSDSSNTGSVTSSYTDSPKKLTSLVKKHQLVMKATNILLFRKESMNQRHDQDGVNTEQKASKVLGVVFAIFVICWAPFFIVNIMTVLCLSCNFDPLLITAFVWLGYVSSTLNPIIYTMFNKTFKMTFVKLLKCEYGTIQKSLRVRWHSKNGYQSTFRTQLYGYDKREESVL